jgi:reverse gyrase
MLKIRYLFGCPNCNGPITADRLTKGIPCENCLPGVEGELDVKTIYELLLQNSSLKGYAETYYNNLLNKQVEELFERVVGKKPWPIQQYWLRKLVRGESFSLSAPTGVGKTTTLIVYSIFFGQTSLFIVPTNSLKDQICKRLKAHYQEVSCDKPEENKINVTTFYAINKRTSEYSSLRPKLVIVDDADMILKSGKTTENIAKILQIPDQVFDSALQLVKLRRLLKVKEDEEVRKRIIELEGFIFGNWHFSSQFIVSSATLRPKGLKQLALRLLTGFEPSTIQIYNRNIIDAFYDSLDLYEVITKLNDDGGLILVSKDLGRSKINEIYELLKNNGIRVEKAISGRKFIDKLSAGEVDFLVGSASYYGVAVRGIDEPKRIKYVIFYGIPKYKLPLEEALNNPLTTVKVAEGLSIDVKDLKKKLLLLSPSELQMIKISIKKSEKLEGKLKELQEKIVKLKESIIDTLSSRKINKLLLDSSVIRRENKAYYILMPDIITYLQGSGRASRLYNNTLTLGLSILLVDDKDLFDILQKRLKNLYSDFKFVNLNEIDIEEVKVKINETRNDNFSEKTKTIKTVLIIVESPTKAKTIAKMFSKPIRREVFGVPVYESVIINNDEILIANILASKGHVTDLTTEEIGYHGVEIHEDGFTVNYSPIYKCYSCGKTITQRVKKCPYCGSSLLFSSEKIINAIRLVSSEVDEVYIATDPDQEGEKIAFDLFSLIKPYNKNVYRIFYHEITKNAILEALRNKRYININEVISQIVRRIEDRWIGFELSKFLKDRIGDGNNGSGRVQGPVLGWIVERTKEYKDKQGWIVLVGIGDYTLKKYFKNKGDAENYLRNIRVNVKVLAEREELVNPYPPYTTDSLLIDAYNKLGINSSLTMKIAQELFEAGLITYHRTDSTHISNFGIVIAREYLNKIGSAEFEGKNWGNEGTHEAIRPTMPLDLNDLQKELEDNPFKYNIRFTWAHFKVYDLVFRRFIASQMKPSKVIVQQFEINVNGEKVQVELPVRAIGGFTTIYPIKVYNVPIGSVNAEAKLKRGSTISLLNYAEVIKSMKEKNIGRPSTYAKTITSLIKHGYVVESKKRSFLIATKRGMTAYEILSSNFSSFISEDRTSLLYSRIDRIAKGEVNGESVLSEILAEVNGITTIASVNSLELKQDI